MYCIEFIDSLFLFDHLHKLSLTQTFLYISWCCFLFFLFSDLYNPGAKDVVDIPPPPIPMITPPPIAPPAAPSIDELIQQSQWNLQQQEQHLHTLRQVQNKKERRKSDKENIFPSEMIWFCCKFFL